ncbi:putative TM nitroreductase [anaerobic digester metagenome]
MNPSFPAIDAIRQRTSVRNYSDQVVEAEKHHALRDFVQSLDNPFHHPIQFHFLDLTASSEGEKLGTYGVIQGARHYLGATLTEGPHAMLALGYEMELAILYLTHLGLGTCWLGGTFDRKGFAQAMAIAPGESFPIITPYGYAAAKKHLKERAMRKVIQADQRKPWEQLFFQDNFQTPLTKEAAGAYSVPLEMVRLGPSASNKQPWRVLLHETIFHFYESKAVGYSAAFPYDIQEVDLGIAAAHFHCSALELGLPGTITLSPPDLPCPDPMIYRFSWRPDRDEAN